MKKYSITILIFFLLSCSKESIPDNPIVIPPEPEQDLREFTILYTNDEHGWIDSTYYSNGAANMMGWWRNEENYTNDESYLILSGGDNWHGPPISNNFKGKSVVSVMNTMGYDAATIGNHEFEFGIPNLYDRIDQANFSFISSNIRIKDSNKIPNFATPYIMKKINDISIGIVGLTPIGTQNLTVTEYVENYDFIDYLTALKEIVPKVKNDGAELIILAAHVTYATLIELAPSLTELGIHIAGGGHCHRKIDPQLVSTSNGDLAVFQSYAKMQSYVRVDVNFDKISKTIVSFNMNNHLNSITQKDTIVQNVVEYWNHKLQELSTT